MADSDLALAMAIAENSDSSQDEDFQLPTHAGQLCILSKIGHPPKRQRKSHCLSKKRTVLEKPQRTSIERKENQDQRSCRNGRSLAKVNFTDPDPLQVRRPLATRKPNVENRTLPSPAESSKGDLSKDQDEKGETAVNKAQTCTDRAPKVLCDQPSEAHGASSGSYLPHYCQKEAGETRKDLFSSVPESYHSYHNQAKTQEEVMLEALKGGAQTFQQMEGIFKPQSKIAGMAQTLSPRPSSTVEGVLHHIAQKPGDLLVEMVEGNATFSSMNAVISLAEEDDLVIDLMEPKQQQFEPDCIQQGNVPAVDCLSSGNVNPDSQFNALLNLCVNSVSDDEEVDELHADSLDHNLAVEDGSVQVEELICSLLTQKRCREPSLSCSSLSCDVYLEPIEASSEVLLKSHTENNPLLTISPKTCLEAPNLSLVCEDFSDCKQDDADGKPYSEGTGVCIESNLEQPLECPVCGSCITGLSLEQREAHTNACLDSIDRKETRAEAIISFMDTDQLNRPDGKSELGECVQEDCSLDLTPVLRWLQTLNLSRYADIFVREEIDWDTLKCLTDEDFITLGITALGPRRKILHALQQLEKGRHDNLINSNCMNRGAENKQQVEADTTGKKRITDFFELPTCLQGEGASGPQTEPANKERRGGSGGVAARKRIMADLAGIPEWMSIPGTKFYVDAFQHPRADCSHWFLTHFHTDHYQGLTRAFRYGHVYCSPITAQLVNTRIGVPWERLKSLPLDQTTEIDGVKVTLIDANHCPGSVMILFQPQNGKAVLHTGDFRFSEDMASNLMLQACNIHTVILDTTYCNPQYVFPKQEVVIQFIIDAIQAEAFNPSTLFLIGTYTIGKERIFFEVAKALQKKIFCSATKLRLLQCMNFPDEDMKWLTTNERDAHIHVVPLWSIASFKRMNYIARHNAGRYNSIVSFSPTGWSFGRGKKRTPGRRWRQGTVVRYEVPYSEHCSFKELKDFVKFTNPVNIIPSVYNDSAEAADALIALLLNEEEDG
ncbi:hypothetical protein GOP47_0008873 [Adiantum capillus-veneris]|uniref:SAM domain-containing protein n=1 Tax=Adiantum capillus-veneris TaxID=13818 RepID=A0A9D4ZIF6_ADICA|nr:hypothetical protein GOP47_0008873 [Adiantum capillus-veneris]